jgi:hypothetical protein
MISGNLPFHQVCWQPKPVQQNRCSDNLKDKCMEFRIIQNKRDHKAALLEIERLWAGPDKLPEAERLCVLALLVRPYALRDLISCEKQ